MFAIGREFSAELRRIVSSLTLEYSDNVNNGTFHNIPPHANEAASSLLAVLLAAETLANPFLTRLIVFISKLFQLIRYLIAALTR